MKEYKGKKRKGTKGKGKQHHAVESYAESFYGFARDLLDVCISAYMLLILVVMPFYNEEGFKHIGTDKATFLRYCIVYGSKIILPVVAVTLLLGLVVNVQKRGLPAWKSVTVKDILAVISNRMSATDYFALCYGACVVISYLCSSYREEALWGTKGWFMGLIPQISMVAVYFLISRGWRQKKWILALILPVSAIVFALGYLNRFGIYPINMQLELPAYISTIGNINWYCGYLVSLFFGVLLLVWQTDWKSKQWKWLFMAYLVIGFATLATHGSNSGIVAMLTVFLVLFWWSAKDGSRMEMFWLEMVLFSATCLVICILRVLKVLTNTYDDPVVNLLTYSVLPVVMVLITVVFWLWVRNSNGKGQYSVQIWKRLTRLVCGGVLGVLGLYFLVLVVNTAGGGFLTAMLGMPEENFLHFTLDWGSHRAATWSCSWLCFTEQNFLHKIIGVGPDCMSAFLYAEGSDMLVGILRECFGEARLTNAHNEWLTILVNIGVVGLVSFAGMMTSAVRRFVQVRNTNVIAAACGISILAYTINNMFSFQQSMSLATIFVVLGIGENAMRTEKLERRYD